NILISDDGMALLSDFGLAAVQVEVAEISFLTMSGSSAKGTCRWMSHELNLGDDAQLTKASDIWAFGCVLVEVLSGRVPFYELATDMQVILAVSRGDLPSRPPRIRDTLWKIMLRCWALVPSDRPSAGSLLQRLSDLKSDVAFLP
ncbi:kinase-like protein, partial [Auricularia subglabra TFB-10046 SS5]